MADITTNRSSATASSSQPSRLQRRRPATLQINPPSSSCWNAAIPLLSPLVSSPTAVDSKSQEEQQQSKQLNQAAVEPERKALVLKKWQHPAAPFYYEPAQFAPSFFVPV